MVSSILNLGVLLLLFGFANSLQVTPGSPCAAVCLDHQDGNTQNPAASSTNSSDISCLDSDYSSSSTGIKFENCLSCLKDSKAVSGSESDVSWFLYNLRYAVDVCVFGSPNAPKAISSPCDIDYGCAPLAQSLKYGISNPNNASEFGYCTAGNGAFKSESVEACYQCFQASDNQAYLANFLIALQAGCEQTPAPGSLLGISGTLFSDIPIKITAPPPDASDDASDTSKTGNSSPTSMTTGAIVGIAIGGALLFLGSLGLFIVHHRREKKARERDAMGSDYDPRGGSGSISAPSKGAFTSYDSKPSVSMISDYELKAQRAYTNNANYYDLLEKEMAARRANYNIDTRQLPTHPAYIPGNTSRGPSRTASPAPPAAVKYHAPDSYVMQQYLNAVEDVALSSGFSNDETSKKSSTRGASSPSPPPARHNKVPSLSMPTVPHIRVPKKYSPPVIAIQGATPVDTQEKRTGGDTQISMPLTIHERRFQDRGLYITSSTDILEQQVAPPPRLGEDLNVRTGNSSFYG
ncbi:hypothetical protein GL218_02182 [Daldinia childiae]|uniref:uncharacterized protein n=1 Tax=Daldinia childiae TaxID=326645 RepID=UPI0014455821|nr:uncharacterized protein GL218_02182 [Daldinia childiae]KAF3064546.1 hypothetical protein GL218_02182 [Daldinia childiae]